MEFVSRAVMVGGKGWRNLKSMENLQSNQKIHWLSEVFISVHDVTLITLQDDVFDYEDDDLSASGVIGSLLFCLSFLIILWPI